MVHCSGLRSATARAHTVVEPYYLPPHRTVVLSLSCRAVAYCRCSCDDPSAFSRRFRLMRVQQLPAGSCRTERACGRMHSGRADYARSIIYTSAQCRQFGVHQPCRLEIQRGGARVQRHARARRVKPHRTRAPATGWATSHRASLRQGSLWSICHARRIAYENARRLSLVQLDRGDSRSDVAMLVSSATRAPGL